jgi:predicted nucleic acid-binding protein
MHQVELDLREELLQNLIAKYEKGYITISKVAEISGLHIDVLLQYINNKKVLESIETPDEEIIHPKNPICFRKIAIIDETMLILLARIKKLDLLRKVFDKVFIHTENECDILIGEYQKNHPYWSIKKSLKVVKGGWIDSLKPSEIAVYASKKITDESMVSKKDISFISLSLDNNYLCLTEDLLLRIELKRIRKNTCGLLELLMYGVNKCFIKKEEAEEAFEIAKNIGYTPIVDQLD